MRSFRTCSAGMLRVMRCAARVTALMGFALLLPPSARAQRPVAPFVPASTRTAAMGNAYGMGLVDSDAVFYNAAFNDRVRGAGVSVARYGESSVYTMSAGTDWLGGAIGFGVQALEYRYSVTALRDASGPANLFGSFGPEVSERVVALVYGRRIKGIRLALTAKHFAHRLGSDRESLVLGDVATGATFRFLSIGLAAQNLGRSSYRVSDVPIETPYRAALNVSTSRSYPLGPLDVAGSAAVWYDRDNEVTPAAGIELSYYPVTGRTFFLRGGVRRPEAGERPFTLGAGFAGDKIILDYAFEPFDDGKRAHRFGVKWR